MIPPSPNHSPSFPDPTPPADAHWQTLFDYVQAACEAYHDATAIRDDAEAGEHMAGAIAEAATAIEALPDAQHAHGPLPF